MHYKDGTTLALPRDRVKGTVPDSDPPREFAGEVTATHGNNAHVAVVHDPMTAVGRMFHGPDVQIHPTSGLELVHRP